MCLSKHYNFDKNMLISKDTDNEHTWYFLMKFAEYYYAQKRGGNDRLGPDFVKKYLYRNI